MPSPFPGMDPYLEVYSSAIDYARPPEIPLPPADAAWAIEQMGPTPGKREHPSR